MQKALRVIFILGFPLAAVLIAAANYLAFLYVPNEQVMGAVQRIFYFHVASAIGCYLAVGILLIAALAYLALRAEDWDAVGEAAGEVGFLFCSITLASGMIWGHVAWGAWFVFEPRLTSFLIMWLLFLSYVLLRRFGDRERMGSHSAILAVMLAVGVPIVWYSINLTPAGRRQHPKLESGGLDPDMKLALFVAMAAVAVLIAAFVALRARIGIEERRRNVFS